MKKKIIGFSLALIGLFSTMFFAGCGESAYEIAVKNGYNGTESQWLESLKGDDGKDGTNGVNYEDIRKLYDDLCAKGEFSGTFLQFVEKYLKVYDMGYEVVANQCVMSSVSVTAYYTIAGTEYYSAGSGIIYDIDEANDSVYIVTNYHVVYVYQNDEVATDLNINLYGSESVDAEIACSYIGGSECYDVAVLKATGREAKKIIDSDAKEVEFGEYNDLTLGESVLAIGNPEATGISVVSGIVSADNRYVNYSISNKEYYHRVFQIDAPINSGNSGGGIFNSDGYLIGLASSKYASSYNSSGLEVVEGIGYGIPLANVVSVADYCIKNCNGTTQTWAKMYSLGITINGANSKATEETENKISIKEDVAITEIKNDSIAKKIGLEVDDIIKNIKITKTNSEIVEWEITRMFLVKDILMFAGLGDRIDITVVRNGNSQTFSYTIKASDASFLKTYENIVS